MEIKLSVILLLLFAAGCSSSETLQKPLILRHEHREITVGPIVAPGKLQPPDPNSALEMAVFARQLAAMGRHREAAGIFHEASRNFESLGNEYENDCRREAVVQYWLAGENALALLVWEEIEEELYEGPAQSEALRRLIAELRSLKDDK